jgi:hypothetical protein
MLALIVVEIRHRGDVERKGKVYATVSIGFSSRVEAA